jgi:hypothetical protein
MFLICELLHKVGVYEYNKKKGKTMKRGSENE